MKRQAIYKCELEIEIQWAVRHKDGPVSVQDTGCIMSGRLYVRKSILLDSERKAKFIFSFVC